MIENWNDKTLYIKGLSITRLVIALIALTTFVLGLLGIVNIRVANNIAIPLLGVILVINGMESYKLKKVLAIFNFAVALFIFGVGLSILFKSF